LAIDWMRPSTSMANPLGVALVFSVCETTADTIARMFFTRWSSSPSSKPAFCSAAARSLTSLATTEAPTIRPLLSLTGETLTETAIERPFLAVLALSKRAICSPCPSLACTRVQSSGRVSASNMEIDWPIASEAGYP
jgi:hypothetical protein